MRMVKVFVTALLLVASSAVAAIAEERIALLIGNAAYTKNVGPLRNPPNDVAVVGDALRSVGFNVTVLNDGGFKAMDTAIRQHIQKLRKAGKGAVGLLYYSGHGAADPETQINYLIPVDVESTDNESIWTNSIDLNAVVGKLREQTPDAVNYVVFDACREELRLPRQSAKALGVEKGFTPLSQSSGLMIAYATAPGKTASDKGAKAGPYASAFAEELVRPGVEAVTMFRNVQIKVKQEIGQDPWLSFPTLPAVYFSGKAETDQGQKSKVEASIWETARASGSRELLKTYLDRYPDGAHAREAQTLLQQIEVQQQREARQLLEAEERRAKEVRALEEELQRRRKEREAEKDQRKSASAEDEKMLKELEEKLRVARAAVVQAEKSQAAAGAASKPGTLAAKIQGELKRIGCLAGPVEDNWTDTASRGLARYLQRTKQSAPSDGLTYTFLDLLQQAKAKTCASPCGSNETLSGDRCVPAVASSEQIATPVAPPTVARSSGGSSHGGCPAWRQRALRTQGC